MPSFCERSEAKAGSLGEQQFKTVHITITGSYKAAASISASELSVPTRHCHHLQGGPL